MSSLDKVRPGGLLAFVTSVGTMDAASPLARRRMAERADFLGAVRLPNTAMLAEAVTQVTTDVLFFQKRTPDQAPQHVDDSWTRSVEVDVSQGGDVSLVTRQNRNQLSGTRYQINNYFVNHPENLLGEYTHDTLVPGKERHGQPRLYRAAVKGTRDLAALERQIDERLTDTLPADSLRPTPT